MTEMFERVVRAVDRAIFADPLNRRAIASAAIEAMREPTEAMIDAVVEDRCLFNNQHQRDVITLDWQCMIDAALEKEKADG